MDEYILEGHALRRSIQRKIPRYWIDLTIEYGNKKKNPGQTIISSISKAQCQSLINELITKCEDLDISKDLVKIYKLHWNISSLQELRDKGGIRVVYNPDTKKIITLYHKKETVFAEFRVF